MRSNSLFGSISVGKPVRQTTVEWGPSLLIWKYFNRQTIVEWDPILFVWEQLLCSRCCTPYSDISLQSQLFQWFRYTFTHWNTSKCRWLDLIQYRLKRTDFPTVILPNEEDWTSFDSGLPTEILLNEDDWTSFDPFDIGLPTEILPNELRWLDIIRQLVVCLLK